MKSVPLPVSPPSPLSEMMSEAPGDISSEIRTSASCGMVTRSSASVAFDAGPTTGAAGASTRLPFTDFLTLTGADAAPGIDTTFQRSVVLSSLTAKAVNTCVPSGRFGSSNVTGASNTGSKPLRTNSLPSLRLTNTEIGPGLNGLTFSLPVVATVLAVRGLGGSSVSRVDFTVSVSFAAVSRGAPGALAMGSGAGLPDLIASVAVVSPLLAEMLALPGVPLPASVDTGGVASGSLFGSGSLMVNSRPLVIATGVTSPLWVTITRTPNLVMPHIWRANARGSRMQPCEAGPLGTTPWCIATPDQVMRCM